MAKRMIACFCTFCLILMLLIFRLGSISTNEQLLEVANSQTRYTLSFNKTRGQIYDRRMNPLCATEEKYIASCLPTPENFTTILENDTIVTGTDKAELMKGGRPFLAETTDKSLSVPDVTLLTTETRSSGYQLAQHIIGYTNSSQIGVTGIEKAYNDILQKNSATSKITYTVDGLRMPLLGHPPSISYAPILTDGVVLTLDSRIQELCEKVGNEMLEKGAIVVMEPYTGKLLAVASFPSFSVSSLAQALADNENAPLINRAFCGYNVGSTFKIATAAAALTQGFSTDYSYECKGSIDVYGQVFGCHEKGGHGVLNMSDAFEVSCNPYFIDLGLQLDLEKFRSMAKDLSFSKPSSFGTLKTSAGYLPTISDLKNPADVGNLAFGQGLLMATPVQIAQMVSAVINDGKTPVAQLVEGFTSSGKLVEQPLEADPPTVAFNGKTAKTIKDFLVKCVMETPKQNAKPQYVTAGGKTGTAQTGQYDNEKNELLQGWFAGFFPAEQPQYVVVVACENAKTGNNDASPIFAKIADELNKPLFYNGK